MSFYMYYYFLIDKFVQFTFSISVGESATCSEVSSEFNFPSCMVILLPFCFTYIITHSSLKSTVFHSLHMTKQIFLVSNKFTLMSHMFGFVYLFILSVTYVTLDTSITEYNLQHIL